VQLFLVAATPMMFALATWDPAAAQNPVRAWMYFYGIPVMAVELIIIVQAVMVGSEPLGTIRAAPVWSQVALTILVLVGFYTATAVAPDGLLALTRTLMWIIHLVFGLCMVDHFRSQRGLVRHYFWPAIVAGLCGYVLMLILYVAAIPDPATFPWVRLWLAVGNIRQVGFYSAVGAAAALGLAMLHTRPAPYALSTAAASLMFAVSFWSGTRGSAISVWVALATAVVAFRSFQRLRALGTLLISTVIGAVLSLLHSVPNALYGVFRIASSVGEEGVDAVSSGRLSMWAGTIEKILTRPLLGYGESQFRLVVPEARGDYNHPHNVVLQILLQWGLVGGLCFAVLAALIARTFYIETATEPRAHLPAFLVVVSLLTMSLFEGTLYHPYPIMMLAVGLAATIGSGRTSFAK
jgi:O-antigen ligase